MINNNLFQKRFRLNHSERVGNNLSNLRILLESYTPSWLAVPIIHTHTHTHTHTQRERERERKREREREREHTHKHKWQKGKHKSFSRSLDQGWPTQLHHWANIFVSILKRAAKLVITNSQFFTSFAPNFFDDLFGASFIHRYTCQNSLGILCDAIGPSIVCL